MIANALRSRLSKTRHSFSRGLNRLLGAGRLEDSDFDDLEEALITADVGVPVSTRIVDRLRTSARSSGASDPEALNELIRDEMASTLEQCGAPPDVKAQP